MISQMSGINFGFDTEAMNTTLNAFSSEAQILRDLQKSLEQLMGELKSTWTTEAGLAFTEMVDTSWIKNINKYTDLLDSFSSSLKSIEIIYEDLVNNTLKEVKLDM